MVEDPVVASFFYGSDANITFIVLMIAIASNRREMRGPNFWDTLYILSSLGMDMDHEELRTLWSPLVNSSSDIAQRELEYDRCTLAYLVMMDAWIREPVTNLFPIAFPLPGNTYANFLDLWCITEVSFLSTKDKVGFSFPFLRYCHPRTEWGKKLLGCLLAQSRVYFSDSSLRHYSLLSDTSQLMAYSSVLKIQQEKVCEPAPAENEPADSEPAESEAVESEPTESEPAKNELLESSARGPAYEEAELNDLTLPMEWRDHLDELADRCMREFVQLQYEPASPDETDIFSFLQ